MSAETGRGLTGAIALFAACIAVAGCTVEAGDTLIPPPVVEPGQLTLRWTVSEAVDPNLCVLGRAESIDIVVSTTAGRSAGEYQAPCAAFATTISTLYPGTYVADALLLDAYGRARTTSVEISPFTVVARSELVIDIDFPADSFLDGLPVDSAGRGRKDAGPPTVPSAPPTPQ